jgi:alpha-L-arabinofuranosidase
LDICASLGDDGTRLVVTLLNRNFRQARTAELELAGGRTVRATTVKVLSASDLSDPDAVFEDNPLKVKKQDNLVRLELKRYSITLLEIELLPCAGAAR